MNEISSSTTISDRLHALRLRLYSIVCIEGLDRHSGQDARKLAVDNFLEDMFEDITLTQPIIKKGLTQDDQDFIKHWLAYQIAERLLESSATVILDDSKVSVKMLAVRAFAPKNK
jgi:hypothetical protein